MNKDKIIKDLKKRNDSLKLQYEYRNIRCINLEHENQKLQRENQQLKKQKDDVVKNAKEKIKRYESYINDLKKGNYPSPTVKQERQELIFRIREQEDLLRILGEIE